MRQLIRRREIVGDDWRYADGDPQGRDRALRWSFDSFGIPSTDLHPAGYDTSRAYGISSRWTVGTGTSGVRATMQAAIAS